MAALPENPLLRAAKIASLPASFALRQVAGVGKRIAGGAAEDIAIELQTKMAEQLFATLGELKGGAMKFGQALSIFESALPEHLAVPYRAALTKLQDSAPPMPLALVHESMSSALGNEWRGYFQSFDDTPAHAASIGQVHKAVWRDGRTVAVKIQYPGASKAIDSDISQAVSIARVLTSIAPGLDIDPLIDELKARIVEELNYKQEAAYQRVFAQEFDKDSDVLIPKVVLAGEAVIVTEWIDGRPLSDVIANGTQEERNSAGLKYERFLLSGPARCGLLHADPHPGNFRIAPDGRLIVFDFGAVAQLPDGLPEAMGRLLRISMSHDAQTVRDGLRDEGFLLPNIDVDAEQLHTYLLPFTQPAETDLFTFSRDWMRTQFNRINDPRQPEFTIGFKINLPPSYMLIHRVWIGSIGVLSQLECTIPARAEIERWVPGFVTAAEQTQ